jgi:antitoxin component YwqK of YwqJK toxin-antitoxin module
MESWEQECDFPFKKLQIVMPVASEEPDTFFHQGDYYSGCAYVEGFGEGGFMLYHIENGLVYLLEAFYPNGQQERRFSFENGLSTGLHEMWFSDGRLYIQENKLMGQSHGIQRRWHPNGQLAREALFKKGEMVWENLFDEEGTLVNSRK